MAQRALKRLPAEFPLPRDVRAAIERVSELPPPNFYERICALSTRLFGLRDARLSEETLNELKDAGLRVMPNEFMAGMLLVSLLPITASVIAWASLIALGEDLIGLLYLPILGAVLSGLCNLAFQLYPSSVAASRRNEAQAQAINTIMLLSFALHHRPDLRGAVIHAADAGQGKLAEDLQRGLLELDEHRRYETVRHLLTVLAHEWGRLDENVRQAIFDLLRSSGAKDEAARLADVAKAPQRVLEGAEEQLGKRLGGVVLPTLMFLVFGSLAIVGLVGLSPVFGMIGLQFIDLKFFAMISASLVAGFLAATFVLERRRPAVLPPPELPEDDPRLPQRGKVRFLGRLLPFWFPPLLAFGALAWPGVLYLADITEGALGLLATGFSTFWLIWAAAAAIAAYAHLSSSPLRRLREEERRKLIDWGTALNTIGSRAIDGKPMIQAMREASELMAGSPLAPQLEELSATMSRYGIDMHQALFERGLAKRIYSSLVTSFLGVISHIRRGSELAAGRACMLAADFLAALRRLEERFRARIDEAMGNLWLVAIVLIPVVSAMSVWIMEFMSGVSFTLAEQARLAGLSFVPFLFGALEAKELALLRLVMGLTSIALALVLARYIATIRAGRDRAEFLGMASRSVIMATIVFTGASALLTFLKMGGGV